MTTTNRPAKYIKPTTATSVEGYLAALRPQDRVALEQLRAMIREVAPDVHEEIQYKMPTFTVGGKILCSMASQKSYLCFYMNCDGKVVAKHAKALAHLNVGKCCIRFKTMEELPLPVIRKILRESL